MARVAALRRFGPTVIRPWFCRMQPLVFFIAHSPIVTAGLMWQPEIEPIA